MTRAVPPTLTKLRALPGRALADVASALRAGHLGPAASAFALRAAVPALDGGAAEELARLLAEGLRPEHAALLVEQVAAATARPASAVELVTSGPDASGTSRDTGVVVRELFATAEERVLVLGFAVHQGREVFAELARRMVACPGLAVRLCLDVPRQPGDTSTETAVVARYAHRFVTREWPGPRAPELYYDPRSLRTAPAERSSLHAKCVVVDGRVSFITSANLTRAAQARNIEIGLLTRQVHLALELERHVGRLISTGSLQRLRLPAQPSRGPERVTP